MLGLTFNAALRTNGALMLAYALAALGGAIAVPVATYSLFVLLCANFIGGAGATRSNTLTAWHFSSGAGWLKLPLMTGSAGFSTARPSRNRRSTTATGIRKAIVACARWPAAVGGAARRRPLDVVARYGGEEIVAVLIDSGRAEAAGVAEGVRRAVAELGIAHSASSTRAHVTVSIGVTTVEPGGDYCHERSVRLADVALYATKTHGRDGWAFNGPENDAPVTATQAAALLKTAS